MATSTDKDKDIECKEFSVKAHNMCIRTHVCCLNQCLFNIASESTDLTWILSQFCQHQPQTQQQQQHQHHHHHRRIVIILLLYVSFWWITDIIGWWCALHGLSVTCEMCIWRICKQMMSIFHVTSFCLAAICFSFVSRVCVCVLFTPHCVCMFWTLKCRV